MGCFIACFGSSKHRKGRRHPSPNPQIHEYIAPAAKSIIIPISLSQSTDKSEKEWNGSSEKKVQFDSDANPSEEEVHKCPIEIQKEKEGEKVVKEEITKVSQENGEENREKAESLTLSDSSMSSMTSYPPMHRYHNCTITDNDDDKEFEDINSKDESSESLFSLSLESRKQVNITKTEEKEEVSSPLTILAPLETEINPIGLNQNGRDRSQYIHCVLNPVENLNQWKAVKSRTTPPTLNHRHKEKENTNLEQEPNIPLCEEPSLKSSNHNSKPKFSNLRPKVQEIEVDTSLSSWLVGSEKTPKSNESPNSVGDLSSAQSRRGNSCKSFEDRPILGALSVEEIKQLTPRRSPSRSREDVAIIGTIGSYWNHTGQTIDSGSSSSCKSKSSTPTKLAEDKRVKCNPTPFATRLERTLDIEIA